MSTIVPLLDNEALARHQTTPLRLSFTITGAKTATIQGPNPFQATFGFDTPGSATAALGQTTIDNLLVIPNEVIAATAFGSTAMGVDAFGLVVLFNNQLRAIRSMHVSSNIGSGGATVDTWCAGTTTALPNTLPALSRCYITSAGNLAAQFVLAGLDAATSGTIQIDLDVELK